MRGLRSHAALPNKHPKADANSDKLTANVLEKLNDLPSGFVGHPCSSLAAM